MAQGLLKKAKAPAATKRSVGPKKGTNGMIAPKKASLIRQKKITKKLTSGLTTQTERTLAQRAGHLELLAGGKKDKRAGKDKEKAKAAK
ncbi:hypothetical protein BJX76DRAFT_360409 [Aspergillus varians]